MNCQKIILTMLDLEEFKGLIKEILLETNSIPSTHNSNKFLEEKLISRKEAAKILGISLPTLTQLVKREEVPAYHLGGRIMFKKSQVLSNLKSVQTLKHKRNNL